MKKKRKSGITHPNRVIPLEEVKKRLYKTHGDKIEILDYTKISDRSNFKCNVCGNIWNAIVKSVTGENGCNNCGRIATAKSCRFPIEYVRDFIESKGCELISKEYVNSKTLLEIKFECGHIGKIIFDSFRSGNRCTLCAIDKMRTTIEAKTRKKFLKMLEDASLQFISFKDDWCSLESEVTYICNRGHTETRGIRNFYKTKRCGICAMEAFAKSQLGSGGSGWKGGINPTSRYLRGVVRDWEKKTKEACNNKCVITGKSLELEVHHIYSFSSIVREAIDNLGIEIKENMGDYDEDEFKKLVKEIRKLHKHYGLGACLTNEMHIKFHTLYGYGDNTPEQFNEFVNTMKNELTQLPLLTKIQRCDKIHIGLDAIPIPLLY